MARIQLEFSDNLFRFSTSMTVRTTDINAGQHLGNDAMVSMLSEARARFLSHFGISEIDNKSCGIVVTDLAVQYKAQARAYEHLQFDAGIDDFNKYGADVVLRVTRPADGVLIAQAKYGFVFFNYTESRVLPVPESFRNQFGQ